MNIQLELQFGRKKKKIVPWNKESIQNLLRKNDKAVVRALQVLYDLQTSDEKSAGFSMHHNRVGFNAYDAEKLTHLARESKTRPLTDVEIRTARARLLKYHGQLARIANVKEAKRGVGEVKKGEIRRT